MPRRAQARREVLGRAHRHEVGHGQAGRAQEALLAQPLLADVEHRAARPHRGALRGRGRGGRGDVLELEGHDRDAARRSARTASRSS